MLQEDKANNKIANKEFLADDVPHFQVGGSLGLWLGLGLLQVMEQIVTVAEPVFRKFQIGS